MSSNCLRGWVGARGTHIAPAGPRLAEWVGPEVSAASPQAEDRLPVPEAESRRVYKQELCYDCGTLIVAGTIDGRATYACPRRRPEWTG